MRRVHPEKPVSESSSSPGGPVVIRTVNWEAAIWVLLAIICGAVFLDALDVSMLAVALPRMGASLHLNASSLQWIVNGYILGYGGFLLLGGRISDLYSRRTVFLIAVSVFGIASVLSALVSVDALLVTLRFIKGASAGFTVPAGLSILTTTFAEGPARNRALGIYTVCGASGFSLGLVCGGLLTGLGWRATLLMPGPVALLLVIAGFRIIPRTFPPRVRLRDIDLLGAVSGTLALLIFVYTIVEAPSQGWVSPKSFGGVAISGVLMAAFVVIELRHPEPLVRFGILRSQPLVHASLCAAAMYASYAAFQFLVTLYLQDSLGWSPLTVALAFLPCGIIVALCAPWTGAILERLPTARVILGGLVAFVLAYSLFLRTQPGMAYADFMLPTMIFLGIGFGLTFAALNSQATAGVEDQEQGLASGLLNTSLQLGGALGLAVVTAIVSRPGLGPVPGQLLPGMITAIWVVVGISSAALLGTAVYIMPARRAARGGLSAARTEAGPVAAAPVAADPVAAVNHPADPVTGSGRPG
jgi:MFS family permease